MVLKRPVAREFEIRRWVPTIQCAATAKKTSIYNRAKVGLFSKFMQISAKPTSCSPLAARLIQKLLSTASPFPVASPSAFTLAQRWGNRQRRLHRANVCVVSSTVAFLNLGLCGLGVGDHTQRCQRCHCHLVRCPMVQRMGHPNLLRYRSANWIEKSPASL